MNTRIITCERSVFKTVFLGMSIALALAVNGVSQTNSCATNLENRQLDYWLGNWKIGAPGSSGNAHSTVSLSLDKCLVVENWDGGKGHYGQNIFGYSADEAVGKSITILIPVERLAEEDYVLGRIRRGERVEHFETVLPTAAALISPQGRLALLIGAGQVKTAIKTLSQLNWNEPIQVPESRQRVLLIGEKDK